MGRGLVEDGSGGVNGEGLGVWAEQVRAVEGGVICTVDVLMHIPTPHSPSLQDAPFTGG